jgi:phospholipase C
MKLRKIILSSLLTLFGAGLVSAQETQNLNGVVQHVIVVIQENRTPDNLFHEDSELVANGSRRNSAE